MRRGRKGRAPRPAIAAGRPRLRARAVGATRALLALATLGGCLTADPDRAAAATEGAAAPVRAPDPVRGLDIADRNCSICHAIAAGRRSAHPRAPAFPAIGAGYPMAALRAGLASGEVIGHTGMPQIELAPAQIDDLIAYLQAIAAPAR